MPQYEKVTREISRRTNQLKGDKAERLKALSRNGLSITSSGNGAVLSSGRYPAMFSGLSALCRSENKKFHYTNFLRCDFRGFDKNHMPDLQDVLNTASAESGPVIRKIDCWMKEINARMEIRNPDDNDFKKMKKIVTLFQDKIRDR